MSTDKSILCEIEKQYRAPFRDVQPATLTLSIYKNKQKEAKYTFALLKHIKIRMDLIIFAFNLLNCMNIENKTL